MRQVTVLGSCGAFPEPGRACSGFAVDWDGYRLVLDLGYATLPRLLAHRPEIGRGFAAPGGARQALTVLVAGGPARIAGAYSSSWMRPSKVRLLIMSRATSG
jgi:hypothetical protein